jgi:hypothetical protein
MAGLSGTRRSQGRRFAERVESCQCHSRIRVARVSRYPVFEHLPADVSVSAAHRPERERFRGHRGRGLRVNILDDRERLVVAALHLREGRVALRGFVGLLDEFL